MALSLHAPVEALPRIGPSLRRSFKALGIVSVEDLLWHLPFRYEDFRRLVPIAQAKAGATVTIAGTVEIIRSRRSFRRHLGITEALIRDRTGTIRAVWFNQAYLAKTLPAGTRVLLAGRIDAGLPTLQLTNPLYELPHGPRTTHVGRLVPIYPSTAGLGQRTLRTLLRSALPLADDLRDDLPSSLLRRFHLSPLAQAISNSHFPRSLTTLTQARERLALDALLPIILTSLRVSAFLAQREALAIPFRKEATQAFVKQLSFRLTTGQRKAAWAILTDLARERPMNRMLQGDVGTGKTVVAALAMLGVAEAGASAVLLAPTGILAQQHAQTLQTLFRGTGHRIGLWTSAHTAIDGQAVERRALQQAITDGSLHLLVGTHALLRPSVDLPTLALIVVDEQHRFGVEQRRVLRQRGDASGRTPHFLSLTATPIPRSLALALFGDLTMTRLTEYPEHHRAIPTRLLTSEQRHEADDALREAKKRGEQSFVVCPIILEADQLGVQSATQAATRLREVFGDDSVGLLHGRLSADERNRVLQAFASGDIPILVATPIVEVGIDVPNATVMIIEGAERFGLAQLHQLRGRVGRGPRPGTCLLVAERADPRATKRLRAVCESNDGYALAQADLDERGPGSLVGLEQSGLADLPLVSLRNEKLLTTARAVAQALLTDDPTLEHSPRLRSRVETAIQTYHGE